MKLSRNLLCFAVATLLTTTNAVAREFSVGVHMSLSGAVARAGSDMNEGILAATDVFNQKNPKHQIKLISINDESSPAKAVAAVEKLASQGVVAIAGGFGTNIVGPASDAANKAGLVYLTSGSTAKEMTTRGLKKFFRVSNNEGYSKAFDGLLSSMKVKKVAVIHSTKESPADMAKEINRDMAAKGVKVTLHPFDPSTSDFKPIVNKIKLLDKPDVICMIGYENDYIGILRAAKVLKPEVKAIIGAYGSASPKMLKDFPDLFPSVIGTALVPYPPEFTSAEGKNAVQAFKRLFKKDIDALNGAGYVMATLLFEAIKRADEKGILAKGGLAEELRKTDRETIIGRVAFDANGDNPAFVLNMGQYQNGRIPIVWPHELANSKMNYPALPW